MVATALQSEELVQKELDLYPIDYPFSTLAERVANGMIWTQPEFQRKYKWDTERASQFIESCLMRIPLPACYFVEKQDGKGVYVIDGVQRLTTIRRFLNNEFKLEKLTIYSEFDGKFFRELPDDIQYSLSEYTIRCIVLRKSNPPRIVKEIFARLNKGGVLLENQEIRHALFGGTLDDLLRELAQLPAIRELGINKSKIARLPHWKDDFTEQEELVLRFFAMLDPDLKGYNNLKEQLDRYMEENQNPSEEKVASMRILFTETLQKVQAVFTPDEMFKDISAEKPKKSKTLYDMVMYVFATATIPYTFYEKQAEAIKQCYLDFLLGDYKKLPSFSVNNATQGKKGILNRRQEWMRRLMNLYKRYDTSDLG